MFGCETGLFKCESWNIASFFLLEIGLAGVFFVIWLFCWALGLLGYRGAISAALLLNL